MLKITTCLLNILCLLWLQLPNFAMAEEVACTKAGQIFDASLGRCVFIKAVSKTRDDSLACPSITDEVARKKCFDDIAARETKGFSGEGAVKGTEAGHQFAGDMILGVNVSLAIISLVATKNPESQCISRNIFAGASAVHLLGEAYMMFFIKDKVQELQDSYQTELIKDQYKAQLRAFEFLQEEQEAIAKAADTKMKVHAVMALGYLASAGYAIYELSTTYTYNCLSSNPAQTPPTVKTNPMSPLKYYTKNQILNSLDHLGFMIGLTKSISSDDYDRKITGNYNDLKQYITYGFTKSINVLIPEAEAGNNSSDKQKPLQKLLPMIIGGVGAGYLPGSDGVAGKLHNPKGVLLLSIIAMGMNATLAGAAKSQKEKALSNADKIEKVKKTFEASMGNLCPNGRTDLKDPKCFCFLEGGKKNLTHLNSNTCLALFAKNDASEFRKAGDFSAADPNDPKFGCVTRVGEFDPNCGCKKVKDSSGQNLCKKSALSNINFGGIGNAFNSQLTSKTIDGINNGNLGPSQLNGAQLGQAAISSKKVLDQLLTKPNIASKIPSLDKIRLESNNLVSSTLKAQQAKPFAGPALTSTFVAAPPKGLDPEKLKEAIAKSGVEYEGGGGKKAAAKENNDFNFGFGGGDSQAGAGGNGKVEEFMEKEYDYKNNDIVKRDDVAIWDVISNRYIQSGMRRLFENAETK
jgi:hypothetical protein